MIEHYRILIVDDSKFIRLKLRQTDEELDQAKLTQLAILPQKAPVLSSMKIASKYVSMDQIGGDLFDIFEFDESNTGVLVADVTGHGIPAALISCMSSSLFNAFASKDSLPDKVLSQINDELATRMPDGKFVTAFYAIYDADSHTLSYAIAGHPEAYLVRESGEIIGLGEKTGLPLGIFTSEIAVYKTSTISLQKNDRIFLYTDGILEIANPSFCPAFVKYPNFLNLNHSY